MRFVLFEFELRRILPLQKKYIRRDVWKIWEGEMLRTFRSPLYRREWQKLSSEFVSYPEFFNYVEEAQQTSGEKDPREQK
jgi:hypothetical protein